MTAFERRNEIVDRMKMRKFDYAESLANELGVSTKTIFRDVLLLATSGFPISAEPGRGGGIVWHGSKSDRCFTDKQMVALQKALLLLDGEDRREIENMIRQNERVESKADDIFGILQFGLSQRELADRLGVSKSYISKILTGEKKASEKLARKILVVKEELCEKK